MKSSSPCRKGKAGSTRWETGYQSLLPGIARLLVSDHSGAVVRLVLATGKESIDVLQALTPATRLALKNAQLAAATRTRMTEVQASQRRVVAASDAERRRIERDLHDGAQQRLISAAFQMKLVRPHLPRDPAPLSRAEELVGNALVHLRRLAHGVFPSVLISEGLWVALDELVRASAIPATLQVTGHDEHIESDAAMAAYATAVTSLEEAARQHVAGPARVSGRRDERHAGDLCRHFGSSRFRGPGGLRRSW